MTRVAALRQACLLLLVLLLSAPGMGAELTKAAKRQIVDEWSKKTGTARCDLNNVQILPNFRVSMRTDPEDLVPAGSKVAVTEAEVDEELRSVDLHVSQVGTRRWTEVHLILDTPLGTALSDDQKRQLSAMWARLVSAEGADAAAPADVPVKPPDAGNRAVLTVYQAHFVGFGGSAAIAFNCDGLDLAGLPDSQYFIVDLEPGAHHCYFGVGRNKADISLVAGQEYYLEVKISHGGGAKLRLVEQKEGQAAIQKFKYVEPKNIWARGDVRPGNK
jgi:hypothetical protein